MNSNKTGVIETEESESGDFLLFSLVIKSAGRERLRNKLGVIRDKYAIAAKKKDNNFVNVRNIKEKIEDLFNSYFIPYENLVTVRTSKTRDKVLQDAMTYYTLKKYSPAAKLFKKYLIQNPENHLILLYLGISFLAAGKYTNASTSFNKILKSKNSLLSDEVKWFLALTNLRKFKIEETLAMLNKIGKESIYFRKAGNLVKKISLLK